MFIDTATANSRSTRPQIIISPRTSPYNDSQTPLLETFVGQDAPPTYLEATTPGLYSSRLSNDQGARLLADGEREARDAAQKEEQYRRKTRSEQFTKGKCLKLIAAVFAVLILGAALTALAAAVSLRTSHQSAVTHPQASAQSSTHDMLNPAPFAAQPSEAADKAQTGGASNHDAQSHPDGFIDDDSERPHLIAVPWPTPTPSGVTVQPPSPTESKQVFPIRWRASCGKEYNVKVEEYDFGNTKELNIQEAVHQLDGAYKRVDGWIHVVQAPKTQAAGTVQVRMSYAISPSVDVSSVKYTSTSNSLVIGDPSFPDGFDGFRRGSACLGMSIVIYMADGVELETLKISANHMGMQVHNSAKFSVTKSTHISLTKGTLDSAALNSRHTHLNTISGSISGKYSLLDLLSVTTKSGSVNIDVEPKPATQSGSPSAIFMIDALSSSIRTDFKRKHIPDRDYQIYINTTVGSVDGTFIHGSRTEINSVAGLVTADLLPFRSGDYASTISTNTHAGQTVLTLRSPYHARGVPMTGLKSLHKSTSGAMNITYPAEWVGHIDGTSLSGALHLQGKELELLKENDQPGKNHVEAKKGSGGSQMEFDTVSGGCDVEIGKL